MRLLQCYKQVIPGIEYFDGVFFSAEVKCIKPQKEIYLHLFEDVYKRQLLQRQDILETILKA